MFLNRPPADEVTNQLASMLANDTKVVVGYIKQVPNQPVVFAVSSRLQWRFQKSLVGGMKKIEGKLVGMQSKKEMRGQR